jgi:pSer/pThr/pTyr-binding forkhead associated (FHA) protein/V8-like Glu-specific endopeptidase
VQLQDPLDSGNAVKLVIEIVGGARRGRKLEFDDPTSIKFGRHPSCEVAFDPEQDRDASSRHAELKREGAIYCIYDLDSANGTVVDGQPVQGRTPVAPGAEIEFGAGGPRCRIHYVGVAATVPPTVVKPGAKPVPQPQLGQRTVAMMIDQALRRGRTRAILSAVVAAAVVGTAVVVIVIRLRAKKPSGAEIARQNHDAIFLVSVKSGSGDEAGYCSAFAISESKLATNAHCVALGEDYRRRGGTLWVIQNGHPSVRYEIKRMKRIEGFRQKADSITPDVGLLGIDGSLPAHATLAAHGEYQGLATGDVIYSYGFPGRLSDVASPEATFMEGVIGRITTLDGRSAAVSDTRLIQHSAFTSGGTSGSPIFDGEGRVVAVNTGGYVEANENTTRPLPGYNFAMRVDLVEDLLKEASP